MLSIRLSRTGKKKQPHYRVIVVDKQRDPWGKAIEILGSRNPRTKETTLKEERIKFWIEKGAQPSNTVWNLLIESGVIKGEKRGVTHISKKRQGKATAAKAEADEKAKAAEAKPAEEAPAE
ncbi:MAG: 30S ribosomal protein S16 [Candidatus Uhrbacteria bacterium]|nr:30S ribosomal protein S16 [Patescibacteria group bacterium]MBU1906912.1 30S ribosomal protein S16 [Patescibacteria group bacterium]